MPLIQQTLPTCRGSCGFTMIEAVMTLVLIGILAAVAVPKYFDMQSEAQASKCRYHQALVAESLQTQLAISQINGGYVDLGGGSGKSGKAVDETAIIQGVMKALGGEDCAGTRVFTCKRLCETGGIYTVELVSGNDDTYVINVECSVHKHDGSNGTTDKTTVVARKNAGKTIVE